MTDFFPYIGRIVTDHEEGFVDNPADHGGPTNWGITLPDMRLATRPDDVATLKALSQAEATEIYRTLFWVPNHFDALVSEPLALVLFDQGTVDGYSRAIAALQGLLGLEQDGILGPETAGAANAADGRKLALRFLAGRAVFYTKIVKDDPSQMVFLDGWLDRLFDLCNYL